MNRSYFLTLLFVLLSVITQALASGEKRWRIHNETGEPVPVSIEAITQYTREIDSKPIKTETYDVKEDGFVTFVFDISVIYPNLKSVNGKKVSAPPKPPKYEDDESGFYVAKFNLFEDASLGYVLHAAVKK